MSMNLRTLINEPDAPDVLVNNLTLDTRTLAPGDVFVALPGAEQDGRDFIESALASGAAAVLMESGRALHQDDVRVIPISGLKGELGALANRLYGSPSDGLKVVAVTGTNGKTSVVDLTAQLLRLRGARPGQSVRWVCGSINSPPRHAIPHLTVSHFTVGCDSGVMTGSSA